MKSAPRPALPTEVDAPSLGNSTVVPNPKPKGGGSRTPTSPKLTAKPKKKPAKKKKASKAKKGS